MISVKTIITVAVHCSSHNSLLVAIVAYFVAGILIMKFHKKATGTDVIPNKALWIATPFLIKVRSVVSVGSYIDQWDQWCHR